MWYAELGELRLNGAVVVFTVVGINHFKRSALSSPWVGWPATSLFVSSLQILSDVPHQQGRNWAHGAGRILPFPCHESSKSGNKVVRRRRLVLFWRLEATNPSFHNAPWLSQWPSNFGILQRQSEGCAVTFSTGTDSIFTLSFKRPYQSQQTRDMLIHQLRPLSLLHFLLVNCAKCWTGKKGKRALVNVPFSDPFNSSWNYVRQSFLHARRLNSCHS